ncbi:GNAT family N-acetyltransferase [Lactococcus lactis subsp. lactis]|uniref:GNAT family N-acetyltransferase n=1 Tax=Lactococcus lactis TaxID=1358 RepID=UPI003D1BBBAA
MKKDDIIKRVKFSELNIEDDFFRSLKDDYEGFENWFRSKKNENALVVFSQDHKVTAFMYLKKENGVEEGIYPELSGNRIKIGTFKISDYHKGTSLGKRFLAHALRIFAEYDNYEKIYVTAFDVKQQQLVNLLKRYGFKEFGKKKEETVYVKNRMVTSNVYESYPFVSEQNKNKYLLSILPRFHNKMFSESDLKTQNYYENIASYNNIEKIYLSASSNASSLRYGDIIIPYRTAEANMPAKYSSVVSAINVIVDIKNICDFANFDDFKEYIRENSVFSDTELKSFWNQKRFPWIIKFLYNVPFKKYPNRKVLLENKIIDEERIVISRLTESSYESIKKLGDVDESYFIN